MAEEGGKYTRSSLVMGLNFLFFFLGLLVIDVIENTMWFNYTLVIITFFIAFLVVVGLSFLNRSPIGGIIIGLSLSGSYWIGFITGLLINFRFSSSIEPLKLFGPYASYVTGAFSTLGLFFGLLGFISEQLFFENPNLEAYIFRDYWSNVFSLGKNNRREIRNLDQRMRRAHVTAKDWWRQQFHRVKQAKPELIFVYQTTGKTEKAKPTAKEEKIGDVFDIASGQRIYDNLIDPSDLLGLYKPLIISVPSVSNKVGRWRRLALEEFVSRFLAWFINSRAMWVSYLIISAIFIYSLYSHFDKLVQSYGGYLLSTDQQAILLTGAIISILTLYFALRFHNLSHLVFEKRPDERLIIFSIYLILFLFYELCYQVIVSIDLVILNTVTLFDIGPAPWIISIQWLTLFTLILFLSYVFIHRESEVTNVYLYDDIQKTELNNSTMPYKDNKEKPYWLKNDGTDLYWVLRFMYYWRYELALIPHPDWERVEVWVDARTGDAKWIVSDYHYRELWYKVEGDLRNKGLHVGFLTNFHTPMPFVTKDEIDTFTDILKQSKIALLRILLGGKIRINETKKTNRNHPPDWINQYGLKGLAANFCSDLNWCYWRYPRGIDNYNKYLNYPSTLTEEQPPATETDTSD